jgi:hypothetical protein
MPGVPMIVFHCFPSLHPPFTSLRMLLYPSMVIKNECGDDSDFANVSILRLLLLALQYILHYRRLKDRYDHLSAIPSQNG